MYIFGENEKKVKSLHFLNKGALKTNYASVSFGTQTFLVQPNEYYIYIYMISMYTITKSLYTIYDFFKCGHVCDAIKQNESEVEKNQILFFGICYLCII